MGFAVLNPISNGWFPLPGLGRSLLNGWFLPHASNMYAIYVVQQSEQPDIDDLEPWAVTLATGVTFALADYPWGASAKYWIGISAIVACGSESSAATWMSLWTDADSHPQLPPPTAPEQLVVIPIAAGKIRITWRYYPESQDTVPTKMVLREYDYPNGSLIASADITYTGRQAYRYDYTPTNASGYIVISAYHTTAGHSLPPEYLFFFTDSEAEDVSLTARIDD